MAAGFGAGAGGNPRTTDTDLGLSDDWMSVRARYSSRKKGCSCVEGDVSVLQTEETVPVWSFVLAIPTFFCFKNPYCQEAVAHGSSGSDELLSSLTQGK